MPGHKRFLPWADCSGDTGRGRASEELLPWDRTPSPMVTQCQCFEEIPIKCTRRDDGIRGKRSHPLRRNVWSYYFTSPLCPLGRWIYALSLRFLWELPSLLLNGWLQRWILVTVPIQDDLGTSHSTQIDSGPRLVPSDRPLKVETFFFKRNKEKLKNIWENA